MITMQEMRSKLWNEMMMQDVVYENKYEAKLAWEWKMIAMNAWMKKIKMKIKMLQVLQSSKSHQEILQHNDSKEWVLKWGERSPF